MPDIVVAYMVMAYTVMSYIVVAYIVMACLHIRLVVGDEVLFV